MSKKNKEESKSGSGRIVLKDKGGYIGSPTPTAKLEIRSDYESFHEDDLDLAFLLGAFHADGLEGVGKALSMLTEKKLSVKDFLLRKPNNDIVFSNSKKE